jgi:glyoxylase I family protein
MAIIEHAALFASDLERLRRFYMESFGLRLVVDNSGASPPGYFLADDRGMVLELIERPADFSGVNTRYVVHICFAVADYEKARADFEGRGIVFETETEVRNANMRTGFFRDPDGNRVQIVERIKPLY